MRVLCYYAPLAGRKAALEQQKIEAWRLSFASAGFEPHVLGASDLRKSIYGFSGGEHLRRLRSARGREDNTVRLQRWLAFSAAIPQGDIRPTLCTDYDVAPDGFTPADVLQAPVAFYDEGLVPFAVSVNGMGARQIQDAVMRCERLYGEAHVDDHIIFNHFFRASAPIGDKSPRHL
jgi:hypothetical protein